MPESGSAVASSPFISVTGVSVIRNDQRLLDNVSVDLGDSEFSVIMGSNGAGKSLLMRVIHGLVAPDSGRVEVAGSVNPSGVTTRLHQAMVFQKPVLLRRSVAANVDHVIDSKLKDRRLQRDSVLDEVGLLSLAKRPARLLSGGEQQRLALARALALKPSVLLLDEPTASLDPASSQLIERIVQKVHDAGCKVIFVTHDIGQARRLADDVIFMHKGQVVEHRPAGQFFDSPASDPAAAYLRGELYV